MSESPNNPAHQAADTMQVGFAVAQSADECSWCDCLAAELNNRTPEAHTSCCHLTPPTHRVVINRGFTLIRAAVCAECMPIMLADVWQAITTPNSPAATQ